MENDYYSIKPYVASSFESEQTEYGTRGYDNFLEPKEEKPLLNEEYINRRKKVFDDINNEFNKISSPPRLSFIGKNEVKSDDKIQEARRVFDGRSTAAERNSFDYTGIIVDNPISPKSRFEPPRRPVPQPPVPQPPASAESLERAALIERAKFNLLERLGERAVRSSVSFGAETRNQQAEGQRQAHHYRTQRLGLLKKTLRKIHGMDSVREGIKSFTNSRDTLMDGTQGEQEMHRQLTPYLIGVMTDTEGRKTLMKGIDKASKRQSDKLKEEASSKGSLTADIVIVGAGVQGSVYAAELRAQKPDARIVTIDAGNRLGGQFRSYGERPVFYINSRNFRTQKNDVAGLPGEDGNLNPFGPNAVIQATDFATETYPTNLELGDTAALNQFFSAETMLDVEYVDIIKAGNEQKVVVRDKKTNQLFGVAGKYVQMFPGAGEREPQGYYGNLVTAQEVFSYFANPENKFPMQMFKGKRIAIKGGGDTGRVIAELLTRLGPKEAYGKSTVQMGGPATLVWYGTNFRNRQEFCDTNRSRYRQLSSFIAEPDDTPSDTLLIFPRTQKITEEYESMDGGVTITRDDGIVEIVDMVIDCSTLESDLSKTFENGQTVDAFVPELGSRAIVGRQMGTSGQVVISGPAAALPLTGREQDTFAKGIKENTASMWANSPRTIALARRAANLLRVGEVFD